MFRTGIRVVVAAILALGLSATARAEDWIRVDTDNFVLLTTGNEKTAREWAMKFERFDQLLRMRYRIPLTPSPNRLTIYLLGDSRDVMQALAGQNRGGVAGYYSSQLDGSYAVTQRTIARKGDLSGQEVMFHEYGHHFMFRYFPYAYPGWYREGFAEYYATTEFDEDGNWNYGKPPLYRGATLTGTQRQISARKMLTSAQEDLTDFESYQVYTRGWLLVHMLHSDRERGRQLNDFLIRLGKGEDRKSAAEAAFGDLGQLERDMKKYMGKSPTYIQGREPIEYDGRFDLTMLDDVDSRFESLRLANRRSRYRQDTLDELMKLVESAPDRAYIWTEIASAQHRLAHSKAWREARREAKKAGEDPDDITSAPADMSWALASIDKALALAPQDPAANALKAELLMDVARDHDRDDLWAEARKFAVVSNRANSDSAYPLSLYWKSYAEADEEIPEAARGALARAFELAPESSQLRVDYALDLAMQGEFDRAIGVVEFLVASPHSGEQGKKALAQIEAVRGGAKYSSLADIEVEDGEDEED